MLGKLIKNEFIQTSKSLIAVYSAAGAAIAVMALSYLTKVLWLGITGSVALVIIGFIAFVMTLVMVIRNFNTSLYGNQGYLSFTLPVKSSDMLFAKFLVSFIWIIVSYIVMLLTVLIVVFYAKSRSQGMLESIMGMLQSMEELSTLPTVSLIIKYIVIIGLGSLITVAAYVSFVFFAVTVSNTRKFQHKTLLFGLVFFFIVYMINKGVSTFISLKFPLSVYMTGEKIGLSLTAMSEGVEGALVTYGIGGYIFTALFAVALLAATGYIMEKKVNVK